MKIREIVNEVAGHKGLLQPDISRALPNAETFPNLPNQDPYLQYRFGLAMAAALAVKDDKIEYDYESAFGENLAVIARTPAEEEIVRIAQTLDPLGRFKRQISTKDSSEATDVNKVSPMRAQGPVKRKN